VARVGARGDDPGGTGLHNYAPSVRIANRRIGLPGPLQIATTATGKLLAETARWTHHDSYNAAALASGLGPLCRTRARHRLGPAAMLGGWARGALRRLR
jgi:hypothetical protein